MPVLSTPIVAQPTLPHRQEHTDHWLGVLQEHLARARADCRIEMASTHPGARHRVLELLMVGARLNAQIEAAEATQ